MKLFAKHELFSTSCNANCALEISSDVQKKLMSGNASFIVDLMKHQKMASFTITSLAIQLVNYFFVGKSYLCYDRFVYCAAALMLAFKIREYDHYRLKPIIMSYYHCAPNRPSAQVSLNGSTTELTSSIMNDANFAIIKKSICIAESRLLKVIGYQLDMQLPFDYLNGIMSIFAIPNEDEREHIFNATKIIAFDAYRSYAPLIFNPRVIAVSAFIVSCSQFDILPSQTINNKMRVKLGFERMGETEQYEKWLEELSSILQMTITAEEIKDCLYVMNELLYLNWNETQKQQQQQQQQPSQQLNSKKVQKSDAMIPEDLPAQQAPVASSVSIGITPPTMVSTTIVAPSLSSHTTATVTAVGSVNSEQ